MRWTGPSQAEELWSGAWRVRLSRDTLRRWGRLPHLLAMRWRLQSKRVAFVVTTQSLLGASTVSHDESSDEPVDFRRQLKNTTILHKGGVPGKESGPMFFNNYGECGWVLAMGMGARTAALPMHLPVASQSVAHITSYHRSRCPQPCSSCWEQGPRGACTCA